MFLLAASFLLPWIAGFLLALYLMAGNPLRFSHLAPAAALGMGLGFGIASCVSFFGLLLFGSMSGGYIAFDLLFFLAVILVLAWIMRPALKNLSPDRSADRSPLDLLIGIVFFIVFVFMVLSFLGHSKPSPFGAGDGLQIFSIHARFMLRGGEHWTEMFLVDWTHPDYPLLIPALLARGWAYAGAETPLVPVLYYLLFILATTALSVSVLSHLRGRLQGMLSGMILLSTGTFIFLGADQYADIPVSFYYLATVIALIVQDGHPVKRYLLAGALAAMAAWTKNEGALFLLVVIVSHALASMPGAGFKKSATASLYIVLGALPVLAAVIYFKACLAPPTDLVARQGLGPSMERLLDLSRYATITKLFFIKTFEWSDYTILLLVAVLLVMGISIKKEQRFSAAFIGLALLLLMAGYFLVYVLTPQPLHWHLSFSYQRLFLQLWPMLVFLVFLIANFRKVQSA